MKDILIRFGGSVKAFGNGKVGGYLVQFSTQNDPDLTADFFTKSGSDFDVEWQEDGAAPIKSTVYYNHALDPTIKNRKLGKAAMKIDDVGVWVESQLELRDDYEKAVYKLAEEGKLGWSSGTAPHLVERKAVGNAWEVTAWPLGLDASLTPTPAEPRNDAMSLKTWAAISPTLVDGSLKAETAADKAGPLSIKAAYLGADVESALTIAALSTLVDRLFYSVIYQAIYGNYSYDSDLDDYVRNRPALAEALASIGGGIDEFKDITMNVVEAIMTEVDGAESPSDAAKSIKALFAREAAAPAAARFETQLDAALAAVESCIDRADGIKAKRAEQGRTLSASRLAKLAEIKSRLDQIKPEPPASAPEPSNLARALKLRAAALAAAIP